MPKGAKCGNAACRKPAKTRRKFCSTICQSAHTRNRRRHRRQVARTHWTLHSEHTRLEETSRWWCCDCEAELSAAELDGHQADEHDVILSSVARQCRNCGKPVSTPDPYCDTQCHDAFWSQRFPGIHPGDIVYSDEYSLLNGRYGEPPRREAADLFGPSRSFHIVDLEWWGRKDKTTAGRLESLTIRGASQNGY